MVTIFRDIANSVRWVHDYVVEDFIHATETGNLPSIRSTSTHEPPPMPRSIHRHHPLPLGLPGVVHFLNGATPSRHDYEARHPLHRASIDDRYLKAEGLSLGIIKGCVPVDGDTYDVPAMIETAETRVRVHGMPMPKWGHRLKFGNDPALHRDYSAVTHVAKGKGIPPFLILHVADHPDVSAQAQRLEAVLKDAGVPAKRFAARETNHTRLNDNLGLSDDPPTMALFQFVAEALK